MIAGRYVGGIACLLLALALSGCSDHAHHHQSSALWHIAQRCISDQKSNQNPAPCASVDLSQGVAQGYVLLKDRRGPLQYLLIPTARIHGMESPAIVAPEAPDYFYDAWRGRRLMKLKYGGPIPDDDIALAINSYYGRSQDQLHIHISCVRQDVKRLVREDLPTLTFRWQRLPQKIDNHTYIARRLTLTELKQGNVFRMLAKYPGAKANLGAFGEALVAPSTPGHSLDFVLLATRAGPANHGAAEEMQNHACPQLY